jgi:hypothetical protein
MTGMRVQRVRRGWGEELFLRLVQGQPQDYMQLSEQHESVQLTIRSSFTVNSMLLMRKFTVTGPWVLLVLENRLCVLFVL